MAVHISPSRVARWGWIAVVVNLLVIVWGAFVRASGSGAGCGNHWPLCNGTVIPRAPAVETVIELTHRITSGVALLAVIVVLWMARRVFPRGHRVRYAAWTALVLIIIEALIGAGLVKFELVAYNASAERAFTLAAHLINTQFLLAALALTAWWAGGSPRINRASFRSHVLPLVLVAGALLFVGASGSVASLGNTLFPAESLGEGLRQDIDPTSHFLLRLRVWHPFFAIATGALIIWMIPRVETWRSSPLHDQRPGRWAIRIVLAQWLIGLTTLVTLAPIPMQLLHLLTADLLWISWVLFGATVLAAQGAGVTRSNEASANADSVSNTVPAPSSR